VDAGGIHPIPSTMTDLAADPVRAEGAAVDDVEVQSAKQMKAHPAVLTHTHGSWGKGGAL